MSAPEVSLGKAQKACLGPLPVLWVLAKALQALFLLVLRALALRRSHTGAVLGSTRAWQDGKLIAGALGKNAN